MTIFGVENVVSVPALAHFAGSSLWPGQPDAESVSLPGVEPGLRPSQSRVHPPHSKDNSAPHRGIEPRPTASKAVMRPPHPQGMNQYPDLELNQGLDLRRVQCNPLQARMSTGRIGRMKDIRGSLQGRRLDSHQHASAYKADAFLDRATSAVSTSVRIRTPSSSFGGCVLSQERHSCNAAERI